MIQKTLLSKIKNRFCEFRGEDIFVFHTAKYRYVIIDKEWPEIIQQLLAEIFYL